MRIVVLRFFSQVLKAATVLRPHWSMFLTISSVPQTLVNLLFCCCWTAQQHLIESFIRSYCLIWKMLWALEVAPCSGLNHIQPLEVFQCRLVMPCPLQHLFFLWTTTRVDSWSLTFFHCSFSCSGPALSRQCFIPLLCWWPPNTQWSLAISRFVYQGFGALQIFSKI